ncbi:MAG: HD domain-containing protein [Candidatus Pacebacteria bacterium]|nr:HD domain-containing protein [Candidatus Paceibacterota bacterium]
MVWLIKFQLNNIKFKNMEYTDKIYEAINLVCNLHIHQTRKGNNTPYVSHCFSVAWIVSNYTNNEDVIVAGLLHDVLEDVPEYTKEQITDQFGINVANLVSNVSEPKTDDNGKSLP